jgi:hypothetical protein
MSRLPETAVVERGYLSRHRPYGQAGMLDKMSDTEERLNDLDTVGVTVQVLSYPSAGADLLPPRHREPSTLKDSLPEAASLAVPYGATRDCSLAQLDHGYLPHATKQFVGPLTPP